MASQSTIANEARQVQRLAIVVATIRWHRGGASGLCADCGRQVDPEAMPLARVHSQCGPVPEQLLRLAAVAPGSRAESAAVDAFMRETMRRQQQPRPSRRQTGGQVSRVICFSCAVRLMNAFLRNAGGTLTGVLAAVTPDLWSALYYRCQPGHGHHLEQFLVNGCGKVPALPDLLEVAAEAA